LHCPKDVAVRIYEKISSRHYRFGRAEMGTVHEHGTKQVPFGLRVVWQTAHI